MSGDYFPVEPPRLSESRFNHIWKRVAQGEPKAKDFDDLMVAAGRAKRRLLEFVGEEGPFVFEDGRCFFIDVPALELDHWQWMKIPLRDVTTLAQQAFLTEYERDPRAYFYNNRQMFVFVGLFVLAISLCLLFL